MDQHLRHVPSSSPVGFHFQHRQHPMGVTTGAAAGSVDAHDDGHREWEHEMVLLAMATHNAAPPMLRRSSSADIPIPQFMIPSSAHQLMNKRYALATSS